MAAKFSEEGWSYYREKKIRQVWKMLPMREEGEDWKGHLEVVILELRGLERLELTEDQAKLIEILSKLSGLDVETEFQLYRKTIFDVISLIEELKKDEKS